MLYLCSINTTNGSGSLELSGDAGDPEWRLVPLEAFSKLARRIETKTKCNQPTKQGWWGSGNRSGTQVFHMLSEMDQNRFNVLKKDKHVRTDKEFPSVGPPECLPVVWAAELMPGHHKWRRWAVILQALLMFIDLDWEPLRDIQGRQRKNGYSGCSFCILVTGNTEREEG